MECVQAGKAQRFPERTSKARMASLRGSGPRLAVMYTSREAVARVRPAAHVPDPGEVLDPALEDVSRFDDILEVGAVGAAYPTDEMGR